LTNSGCSNYGSLAVYNHVKAIMLENQN